MRTFLALLSFSFLNFIFSQIHNDTLPNLQESIKNSQIQLEQSLNLAQSDIINYYLISLNKLHLKYPQHPLIQQTLSDLQTLTSKGKPLNVENLLNLKKLQPLTQSLSTTSLTPPLFLLLLPDQASTINEDISRLSPENVKIIHSIIWTPLTPPTSPTSFTLHYDPSQVIEDIHGTILIDQLKFPFHIQSIEEPSSQKWLPIQIKTFALPKATQPPKTIQIQIHQGALPLRSLNLLQSFSHENPSH
jgi:hypothetical protein